MGRVQPEREKGCDHILSPVWAVRQQQILLKEEVLGEEGVSEEGSLTLNRN
jgi:hypothetical protein